jgi:superfamily II DNA/RNA helicase
VSTFRDLGVPADLAAVLEPRGITAPFEIQELTIPDLIAGRDICGRAPTGSGKTLAFGIPHVARVGHAGPKRPRALILAPTRELAAQIERELKPLATARDRRMLTVYGGVGYEHQRKALRKGVDILVACPGRLADLIEQRVVRLDGIDTVVIDEADRMADMGFLPQVRALLDEMPPNRQTVLFSATLDGAVGVLTREYQRNPMRHEFGEIEPDITAADHHFWTVEPPERVRRTAEVVNAAGSTIVFCRTRRGVDRVVEVLGRDGVKAAAIHGGRSQNQRDQALRSFTNGRVDVLVATDVAARGIHVDDVACVVHFDLPADAKDNVHRSGRTARAGARGTVISLVPKNDARKARQLQREAGIDVPLQKPQIDRIPSRPRPARTVVERVERERPTKPKPPNPGARRSRQPRRRNRVR